MTKPGQLIKEQIANEYKKDCHTKDIASFFEFYATYLMMKKFNLSRRQIEKGILGGGDDGGVDAAFCLINKINLTEPTWRNISIPTDSCIELYLYQVKYTRSYREDVILKWRHSVGHLLDLGKDMRKYQIFYNDKVLTFFKNFHDFYERSLRYSPNLRIHLHYVTLSAEEPHPKVVSLAKELEADLQRKFPNLVEGQVHFVGEKILLGAMQRKEDLRLPIRIFDKPVCLRENWYFIQADCQDLSKIPFEQNKDFQMIQAEAKGGDVNMAVIQAETMDYPSENQIVLTNPKIESPIATIRPPAAIKQCVLITTHSVNILQQV